MRRALAVSLCLLCISLSARAADSPARFDPAGSDPEAVAAVDRVQQALGMPEAWQAARYIEFSLGQARGDSLLALPRSYSWDTQTNRCRVEGASRSAGKHFVVIYGDVNDPGTARVWLNGELQAADSTVALFGAAGHGAFLNDTFWLLMPYRMKDPGVRLGWRGVQRDSASAWRDYRQFGPLTISCRRLIEGGPMSVVLRNVRVSGTVNEAAFEGP
jgi:hypothetical protein